MSYENTHLPFGRGKKAFLKKLQNVKGKKQAKNNLKKFLCLVSSKSNWLMFKPILFCSNTTKMNTTQFFRNSCPNVLKIIDLSLEGLYFSSSMQKTQFKMFQLKKIAKNNYICTPPD